MDESRERKGSGEEKGGRGDEIGGERSRERRGGKRGFRTL